MTRTTYHLYAHVCVCHFLAYTVSVILALCLFTNGVNAQTPFVTIWDTSLPGFTATNQIKIPGKGLSYSIHWEEEGNPSNNGTVIASNTHIITFPNPGIYRISITPGNGSFDQIMFTGQDNDDKKIIGIESWGDIEWSSMASAFSGCSNLELYATDAPDLSKVKSMAGMFSGCAILQGHLSMNSWDVSNVEDMSSMFSRAESFNQDIGQWDVSSVKDMSWMFNSTDSFNQHIGNWNVSGVTTFRNMFRFSIAFNQDIGNWDVSNATDFSGMFGSATSFNQNIGGWNVSNVTSAFWMFNSALNFNQDLSQWDVSNMQNMELMFGWAYAFNGDISTWDLSSAKNTSGMFLEATSFNQDLSDWDVSDVEDLRSMFGNASSFNQDLGSWQFIAATDITDMLSGSGLDCINYSATLTGWATSPTTKAGLSLGAHGLEYNTQAEGYRDDLLNAKGWTIDGDQYIGLSCSPCLDNLVVTIDGPTQICVHEMATLQVQDTFHVYHWSTGEMNAALNIHTAGIYFITVTDLQGCTGIDSIFIDEIAAPIIELFSNEPVCHGDTLMISASGGDVISWQGPNGFNHTFPSLMIPAASIDHAGMYTVWMENAMGCSDSAIIEISINEIPDVTDLDTFFCSSENVNWVPSSGQFNMMFSLDNATYSDTPEFGLLNPGMYTLYLLDENNCSNNLDFRVSQGPFIEDLQHANSDCDLSEVSLEIIASGVAPLLYEISGLPPSISNIFTGVSSGLHFISVRDVNGCLDTMTYEVVLDDVLHIVQINISPTTCGEATGTIHIEAEGSLPLLYSVDGLAYQSSNVFEGLSAGVYSIEVVDMNGCSRMTQGIVDREFCPVFIPNAFSPNGDGINDYFAFYSEASTTGHVEMYQIYNRWGGLLHEAYDFPLDSNVHWWDGTSKGHMLNPDVYVFTCVVRFLGQEAFSLSGEVQLMR